MELKEMIKVMQHFENGGSVEVYKTDRWEIGVNPIWDWDNFEYRIKEEKQKVTIEKWLLMRINTGEFIVVESTKGYHTSIGTQFELIKLLDTYEVEL